MAEKRSWQREIDFHCTFGMWPFRRSLDITPDGYIWCGETIPLRSITKIRWGVDQIRGGVLPKRVCVAAFGTDKKDYEIKTKQKDFYEHLTDRYWASVGRRLLREMLDGLAGGSEYTFDNVSVSDPGISVSTKGMFSGSQKKSYAWNEMEWGTSNGSLCFIDAADSKPIAGLSFLWTDNVHVLSVPLGLLPEKRAGVKLSSVKQILNRQEEYR